MMVSPSNAGVPLIAPSVNVPTEQVARDNRAREPVMPTTQSPKAAAERNVKSDEKRRKQSAWDPSDHPGYDLASESEIESALEEKPPQHELERLFRLLDLTSYSSTQGKGYVMRYRLPKHIIDAAITEGKMARRRTVIKYHYGHSIAPHIPSEVIAVL
jgi:hypothetical protein